MDVLYITFIYTEWQIKLQILLFLKLTPLHGMYESLEKGELTLVECVPEGKGCPCFHNMASGLLKRLDILKLFGRF